MGIYEMFPRIYWTKRNPMETIDDKVQKLIEETQEVLVAENEMDRLDEALDAMHCCVEIIRDYPDELVDHALSLHNAKNRKRGYYEPKPTTCENIGEYHEVDQFLCSKCGIWIEDWVRVEFDEEENDEVGFEYALKYCPNCGRKIM